MSPQLSSQVQVKSGAAAVGQDSTAVGQRGVYIGGDASGPIFTGDIQFGNLAAGESGQAINDVLQALLQNALLTVNRPHVEELFQIIRDPAAIPDAGWEPEPGAAVTLFDLAYRSDGRENGLDTRLALKNEPGAAHILAGRSGLGRTREAAELARLLCQEGWTVCLARLETCRKMGETAGTLPDKKVLLVIDDLHRHAALGASGQAGYLDRLQQCLALLERDPAIQLRLLATMPGDDLPIPDSHPLARRFRRVILAEFTPATLQEILQEAAAQAGVTLVEAEAAEMVGAGDGTSKTIVANVNLAQRNKTSLTLETWRDTAAGIWRERFLALRQKEPLADAVYRAVYLLQVAGLPPRLAYVAGLVSTGQSNAVEAATNALLTQGLLRRRNGALHPLSPDQLSSCLEAAGQALPALNEEWPHIVEVLLAAAPEQSNGAADLVTLADMLNDYGRHAEAEKAATAALTQEADLPDAYLQRGRARLRQDAYATAEADYTAVIDSGQTDPQLFLARGLCRLAQLNVVAAEGDFDQAEETDDPLIYQARGLARMLQRKYAGADTDFDCLLASRPEANEVRLLRGFVRFMQGQHSEAVSDFDYLLAQAEAHPSVFFMRGWIAYLRQDWDAAEHDLVAARERGLSQAFLHLLLAEIHLKQEKYAAVIADSSAAIAHWSDDDYMTVLTKIAHALPENAPDLAAAIATLLKENPDWLRRLILATSGVGLNTEAEMEAMADYWGHLMSDVGTTNQDFFAQRYLAAMPYLFRGLAQAELGNYMGAAEDFTTGMAQGLEPAVGYYNRGLARFRQHQPAAAEDDFTLALTYRPDDGPTLFYRGLSRFQTEQYPAAEADLTQAIQAGMDNGDAYAARAWLRWQRADFNDALADFDLALERDPDNGRTYYGRGNARLHLGDLAAAEADYTAAISRGFDEQDIYLERAAVRLELGQAAGAEQDATLVLTRMGDHASAYALRGAVRCVLGDYAAAKADLDAALAGGLLTGFLFYHRAVAHFYLGMFAEAEENYTSAFDHDWPAQYIYFERGWTRFLLGRYQEAESDLSQAVQLDPDNGLIYLCRGLAYIALEYYAAAVEDYSTVLAQNPKTEEAYQRRALAFVRLDDLVAAEADCRQAKEMAPQAPLTYLAWAELHLAHEEYGAAVDACRQALNLGVLAESYFTLGLSELLAGNLEAALAAYEAGLPLAQGIDRHLGQQALGYWQQRRPERLGMAATQDKIHFIRSKLAET